VFESYGADVIFARRVTLNMSFALSSLSRREHSEGGELAKAQVRGFDSADHTCTCEVEVEVEVRRNEDVKIKLTFDIMLKLL
jgi:hypothetical protein